MKWFLLGMILLVLGDVRQVQSFPDIGNCECQHKCVLDKLENSTYIARVTVKHEITSEYEGARAYRVSVTKEFPNSVENVERITLLNDVHCPAKLDLHTKFLLAGSEVKYTPCNEPIMWINSCDVVVQWKRVTKKQRRLLRDGIAFDFCADNPCDAGEVCSRSDTEKCYTCKQSAGSEEDDCEQDIDDCQVKPCQNGGICTDGDNTYTCSCAAGFDGHNCENNIDDCQVKPCQNGGICTDGVNRYTCSCVTGFDGDNCENIDCDFDHTMCGWTQDQNNDAFDWRRESGGDDDPFSGPSQDHTTGNGSYMVARGIHLSDTANLISPTVLLRDSQDHCLKFWFLLYGQGYLGELNVNIKDSTLTTKRVAKWSSGTGKSWVQRAVTLSQAGPLSPPLAIAEEEEQEVEKEKKEEDEEWLY